MKNVEKVRQLMRFDRRLSIRVIAVVLNLHRKTVNKILIENLGITSALDTLNLFSFLAKKQVVKLDFRFFQK